MERQDVIIEAAPQVFLQPIAAPSILGLFGFAVATMMVSTSMLGWYGNVENPLFIFPFAAFFGGLAQFIAAVWSFRARDGLAVAMHGTWGSFWMAYGLLYLLTAAKLITLPANGLSPDMGMWFVGLAWVTWMGAWASGGASFSLVTLFVLLAAGATTGAIANFSGSAGWVGVTGWLLLLSAVAAWYTASALMLESAYGRAILPLGKVRHAEVAPKVAVGIGEPGVMHGQ